MESYFTEARPRVSVVIPTMNERENLPHVLPRIPPWVHEVILIDGHSTDGTLEAAQEIWPNHHIVRRERRAPLARAVPIARERRQPGVTLRLVEQVGRGKGDALRQGFSVATGEIIVMLDADGSTAPEEIPSYIGSLLAGADFAKGSRFLQGGGTADMPRYRQLGNAAFVHMVRLLFGGKYSDLCYGYNAFWSRLVPTLGLDADGFEIETLMNIRALKANLRIAEVPSFEYPRVHGIGRLRAIPDGWRVLQTIGREWRAGPRQGLDLMPVPPVVAYPAAIMRSELHMAAAQEVSLVVNED